MESKNIETGIVLPRKSTVLSANVRNLAWKSRKGKAKPIWRYGVFVPETGSECGRAIMAVLIIRFRTN